MNISIFNKKAVRLAALTLALAPSLFSAGCGQGFAAAQFGNSNFSSGFGGGGNNGSNSSPSEIAFRDYPAEGAVDGGGYDNEQVIRIDKETKELIIGLPMMQFPSFDSIGSNLPISQIPGAKIGMEDVLGNGSGLTLRIPLSKVLNGVDGAEPTRLPNGDPLPAIPDGELPSFAVSLSKKGTQKATIYLAPSVVGIFVNSSFDPKFAMTFPIRNKARTKTWGYFSTIPAKGTYQGGFFLSFALPDDLARIIDDMM